MFSDQPTTKVIASFAGFDVARTSDKSAIVMVDQLADGTYFVRDILVMSNMKYADQMDIVKNLYKKEQWASAYVDAVGLGSPVAEHLHDNVSARIKPFQWTESTKSPAYEHLRSMVFDHKIVFSQNIKD